MKCEFCSEVNSPSAKFCRACGKPVGGAPGPGRTLLAKPIQSGRRSWTLPVLAFLLFVAGAGAGGWVWYDAERERVRAADAAQHQIEEERKRANDAIAARLKAEELVQELSAAATQSSGDELRAQVSEAISLLGAAKTPIAEYFEDRNKLPDRVTDVVATTSGKYTQSIEMVTGPRATDVVLIAALRADLDARIAGKSVAMRSPDGGRTWSCESVSMPQEYLPGACRR